jgi:hypothetical protein
MISKATCARWGSQHGARRVAGLTAAERAAIREGLEVRIVGCPMVCGVTDRRVIEINGRFYARMPKV